MKFKHVIAAIVVCNFLVLLTACSSKDTKIYLSKKNDYTLVIPYRWKVVDDDRKLTEVREAVNKETPVQFQFNPDAMFGTRNKTGAMILILPIPLDLSGMSQGDESKYLMLYDSLFRVMGFPDANTEEETINGKLFKLIESPIQDGGKAIMAACLHKNQLYAFNFFCKSESFSELEPIFRKSIRSISFNDDDIQLAKAAYDEKKDGFIMGFVHGLFFPFRLIGSFIFTIDLYSDHNTGTSYLAGFVIGILALMGGGGGASSSR